MLGNVLRAPGNAAARQGLRDLCEVGKRCAHRVTETFGWLEARLERLQQPCVRCEAAVHLPVACYEPRAHPVPVEPKRGRFYRGIALRVNRKGWKTQSLADVPRSGPRCAQPERHRAVVHQSDLHVLAETAARRVGMARARTRDEMIEQLAGRIGRECGRK